MLDFTYHRTLKLLKNRILARKHQYFAIFCYFQLIHEYNFIIIWIHPNIDLISMDLQCFQNGILNFENSYLHSALIKLNMGLATSKPVFRVSDKARLKPVSSATDIS